MELETQFFATADFTTNGGIDYVLGLVDNNIFV